MDKIEKKRPLSPVINTLKLYCVFWGFLIMIFSAIIYIQTNRQAKLSAEIDMLGQRLDAAAVERQSLRETIDFNKSDKYIEKYTHDEFGLVHSNEIIIYNDNYKTNE
ncbi:MAG: septum formation initiator family protein [Clostridiales bacterium]|jgi:cell division protein FtsB|nr:septum formation initiator family protein [Clostridiales bacterium]